MATVQESDTTRCICCNRSTRRIGGTRRRSSLLSPEFIQENPFIVNYLVEVMHIEEVSKYIKNIIYSLYKYIKHLIKSYQLLLCLNVKMYAGFKLKILILNYPITTTLKKYHLLYCGLVIFLNYNVIIMLFKILTPIITNNTMSSHESH